MEKHWLNQVSWPFVWRFWFIGWFACKQKTIIQSPYLSLFVRPFISVTVMSYWQLFVPRICHRSCDRVLAAWTVSLLRLFTRKSRHFISIKQHRVRYECTYGSWAGLRSGGRALFSFTRIVLHGGLLRMNNGAGSLEMSVNWNYNWLYNIAWRLCLLWSLLLCQISWNFEDVSLLGTKHALNCW
jgi:hypothetical protein